MALGNLGWAYYQLGDAQRALDMFLQAEKSARQFRAVHVQLIWLMAAGCGYLDRGEYSLAEKSYLQGLDLAEQINGKEDILTALMSLALVSEQAGKLEQASQYAKRAIRMAGGWEPIR